LFCTKGEKGEGSPQKSSIKKIQPYSNSKTGRLKPLTKHSIPLKINHSLPLKVKDANFPTIKAQKTPLKKNKQFPPDNPFEN
jgi:hypothetical protein